MNKQEIVEILQAALNHPTYLGTCEGWTGWFCVAVERATEEKGLRPEFAEHIQEKYIYPSINEFGLLKHYFIDIGKIDNSVRYHHPEYKAAAFEHWTNLIEKVKGEV